MKRIATLGLLSLTLTSVSSAGVVDPGLNEILDQAGPNEIVSTLVYMNQQVDPAEMNTTFRTEKTSMHDRRVEVVLSLQDLAAGTQIEILDALETLERTPSVEAYEPYWIANVIRVDGTPDAIRQLANRADVDTVYFNLPIEHIGHDVVDGPIGGEGQGGGALLGGVEPGVEAVRAPEVWDMGITGEGVVVSTLDTGVSGTHPALASRWRGNNPLYADNPEWAFFDPVTSQTFPFDSGSHGTHTMGSVCGGMPGDQVGVAPGVEWIHCAVIDRVSIPQTVADAIESFQWLVNPDGNPLTTFDVPDTCSNSWGVTTGHGYPQCDETFWVWIDNSEAAGIVQLFSAGNEGFSGLRRPADRATDEYRSVAVAAVNANVSGWPIAGFSSRGPTNCTPDGSSAIKPDISAPGESVRSSVPGGGYSNFSGTSMASPHINGVVALMRQANPELPPDEIKQIIYETAFDLGSSGKDNNYGYGMVDAFEAVTRALETVSLVWEYPDGRPEWLDPAGGTTVRVLVSGPAGQVPETGLLHFNDGSGWDSTPLEVVGAGAYDLVFPAFDCEAEVQYYVSIETLEGDVATNPFAGPGGAYQGLAVSGEEYGFQDDFEDDLGWTVTNDPGLESGAWERGVPLGGERGDPGQDADGSGQCFVTENGDGNFDIDGGWTTLTSPVMDASDGDLSLEYHRWYSNDFGAAPEADTMVVEVSDDGGASWVTLEVIGPDGSDVSGGWRFKSFRVSEIAGISPSDAFRVRFTASDLGEGSVVEAGVDGVQLRKYVCDLGTCTGDVDGNGSVETADLLELLASWGPCEGCPADLDQTNFVDTNDLLTLLAAWGSCP